MLKITGIEGQNNHSSEVTLHQREIIDLIDGCTQILKQDKLYLRNRLKKFFQDPDNQNQYENQNQNSSMKDLLQIFVECKKPINKVKKYQKHFHWLQVKLRKFIAAEKKRQKDEKIKEFFLQSPTKNNFSCRDKTYGSNNKNNLTNFKNKNTDLKHSHRKGEKSMFESRKNQNYENLNNPFQSVQATEKKMKIQKIDENQMKKSLMLEQKTHLASYQNGQIKSYREKRDYQKWSVPAQKSQNKSLQRSQSKQFLSPKSKQMKSFFSKYSKLTPSHAQSYKKQDKSQQKSINSMKKSAENFNLPQNQKKNEVKKWQKKTRNEKQISKKQSIAFKQPHISSIVYKEDYEEDCQWSSNLIGQNREKKIKNQMSRVKREKSQKIFAEDFEYEEQQSPKFSHQKKSSSSQLEFSEIKRPNQNQNSFEEKERYLKDFDPQISSISSEKNTNIQQNKINQQLFTPKQILDQCKMFLETGKLSFYKSFNQVNHHTPHKARKQQQKSAFKNDIQERISMNKKQDTGEIISFRQNYQQAMTNESYLMQNKTQTIDKNSAEKKLPLKKNNVEYFEDFKSFLQYIFKKNGRFLCQVIYNQEEIQKIFERVPEQIKYAANQAVDLQLNEKISFNSNKILNKIRQMVPQPIKFYLSNIFQLIDVSQKGIISGEDFQNFLENFDIPQLKPQIFQNLCQHLQKFRNKIGQIFGEEQITIQNLQFLELIQDPTIFQLAEFLQQFEFQIYS